MCGLILPEENKGDFVMLIDTSVLIGRKCAEFADQLGRVLLRGSGVEAGTSVADFEQSSATLNHVADLTCCG